jgi:hypothetical protein
MRSLRLRTAAAEATATKTAATSATAETTTAASASTTGAAATATGTRTTATATATRTATGDDGLARQQAFALHLLAGELTGAAHGFRLLAHALLGRLLEVVAQLHLAEDTLALHLFLQRFESLIDIVIADENLHR